MREIRFRGLHKTGVFVFGNLLIGTDPDGKPLCQIERTEASDFQQWDVDRKTVGEFTGLKDKNGKECFEGDIVPIDGKNCIVKFDVYYLCGWIFDTPDKTGCYSFNSTCTNFNAIGCQDFEIIGNIHTSPEPKH